MKNLELLELVHKTNDDIFFQAQNLTQTTDNIYFIANNSLHKYDFNLNKTTELCPKTFENVISIKILSFEGKICLITQTHFNIFNLDGIEIHSIEFEEQIETIAWNPTEEFIATVSANGNVRTFTVDYEFGEVFPQGSSNVIEKIPDTVYVGWGSKDTQFRGSEGKIKKDQTTVAAKPVEDKLPTISWRGNGEMFAVNYWLDNERLFTVFETPCKAVYRSENCPGLQPLIAWRPAGNMIAAITEINNTQSVVIFEKNGQKRFSFVLDFGDVVVKSLRWSLCAQILAIYSESPSQDIQNIHLMTSSNYKWYEKQTLTFVQDNPLVAFDWLETTQSTFTLIAVTKDSVIKYTFHSHIHKFSPICGVINGKQLQISDFSDEIIPPILFSKIIENDAPINFALFHSRNLVILVDSKNILKIFDINNLASVVLEIDLSNTSVNTPKFPLAHHHFTFNDLNIYFASETDSETVISNLDTKSGEINFVDATTDSLRHLTVVPINENCEISDLKQINNQLFMNNNNSQNSIKQSVKIVNNKAFNCQLTANCHFYVNDTKINDSVDSFTIFEDYLLFTTKLNELFCVRLQEEALETLLHGNLSSIYKRSIEQGAVIVTAIPNSPRVVLQLPRGNLETISCRLISIDILDRLLNDQNWEEAVRFIRLEKLNANLLFDLNPERFLGQIDKFISSVKTVNELNSICLEFEEGNVLNSLYKNWGKSQEYSRKTRVIYGEILKYLDEIDYAPYISTIIIINLNFFSLRDALVYVQDLLRRSYDDVNLKKSVVGAVNILKTYGSDQEQLYKESLLLYDLDLAHFVASCCQMDPRIYDPHISSLKSLTEVERRYEINMFAKKPKVAIAYLLRCPKIPPNNIIDFFKNHKVSREAYENCRKNSKFYQIVSKTFAEDLSRKGCHQEAGVILKRANLFEEALEEFKLGLRWREVLDLVEILKIDEVEKLRVVNDLAGSLAQRRNIKDAVNLYEFYAKNYEMAVKVLTENRLFEEALHVARKYGRTDVVVADILPALFSHKEHLKNKIEDMSEVFHKYKSRLAVVRETRVTKFNFGYDGDDRGDLFSDAGSVISRSSRSSRSRSSTLSSRNRRKEEKKKQDLREGGFYEDIALVRALYLLIKEIYGEAEEIKHCCILLIQESDLPFEEVKSLYNVYMKIDEDVKDSLTQIWPPHFQVHNNNNTQDVQQLADLDNLEHLDVEYRNPPSGRIDCTLNLFI